jgi:hypothetical protein
VILVVTALRQHRPHTYTLARLQAMVGVTRPTLTRWLHYFRKIFPFSDSWRRLSAHLMPPVDPKALPAQLVERFVASRGDPEKALFACLTALLISR